MAMSPGRPCAAGGGTRRRAVASPAQDQEFVLAHCDSLQATGFVEHLKLPHYVDFQAELELVRRLRAAFVRDSEPVQEAAE